MHFKDQGHLGRSGRWAQVVASALQRWTVHLFPLHCEQLLLNSNIFRLLIISVTECVQHRMILFVLSVFLMYCTIHAKGRIGSVNYNLSPVQWWGQKNWLSRWQWRLWTWYPLSHCEICLVAETRCTCYSTWNNEAHHVSRSTVVTMENKATMVDWQRCWSDAKLLTVCSSMSFILHVNLTAAANSWLFLFNELTVGSCHSAEDVYSLISTSAHRRCVLLSEWGSSVMRLKAPGGHDIYTPHN